MSNSFKIGDLVKFKSAQCPRPDIVIGRVFIIINCWPTMRIIGNARICSFSYDLADPLTLHTPFWLPAVVWQDQIDHV